MNGSAQADAEYRNLRDTIRQRGTARIVIFWLTLTIWATVIILGDRDWSNPLSTLVPLVILAGGFEAIFALHVGIERIGRYLEVFYEAGTTRPAWERTAAAYGAQSPKDGMDAMFITPFALMNLLNFYPALLVGRPVLTVIAAACHVAFAVRLIVARRYHSGQRARDLSRFTAIRDAQADGTAVE